jgi:hypothetical protein
MNVIESWRNRGRLLRAEYRRCASCGAFAGVRRLACTRCGADMSGAQSAALPKSLTAAAFSHAHLVVERMDQKTSLDPAVLVRIGDAQLMAFPLAESDASLGSQLVGEELALTLRRTGADNGKDEALAYQRKATATAATRARLKKTEERRREERRR